MRINGVGGIRDFIVIVAEAGSIQPICALAEAPGLLVSAGMTRVGAQAAKEPSGTLRQAGDPASPPPSRRISAIETARQSCSASS